MTSGTTSALPTLVTKGHDSEPTSSNHPGKSHRFNLVKVTVSERMLVILTSQQFEEPNYYD